MGFILERTEPYCLFFLIISLKNKTFLINKKLMLRKTFKKTKKEWNLIKLKKTKKFQLLFCLSFTFMKTELSNWKIENNCL